MNEILKKIFKSPVTYAVIAGIALVVILPGSIHFNRQIKEYRTKLERSRATVDNIEKELKQARELNDELKGEIETSRQSVDRAERRANSLKEQLRQATDYIGQLEQTNNKLREGSDLLEGAIENAANGVRQLIEDLEKEELH